MTRWPQPDFLSHASRAPALAWWLAITGALVLALNVADALALRADIAEQNTRLSRATQRIAAVKPPRAAASANTGTSDRDGLRSALQVTGRLAHPWGELLATLEASTPADVHWLRFEHDSERPDLRLEGQARDVASVLWVVEELSARVGWSDVVVTRLQAADAREVAGGGSGLRFEIAARLAGPHPNPLPQAGEGTDVRSAARARQ
jgi:hypothetical protein